MTVPVPAGAGGVDPSWCMRDCGCTLERGHDGKCDLTGPLPKPGCRCDHCLADAAGVEVAGEIARLRAALAAAEQRADTLASAIERVQDVADELAESIANPEPPWHVDPRDEATAQRAMRWMHGLLRAALSSRPVQPEGKQR